MFLGTHGHGAAVSVSLQAHGDGARFAQVEVFESHRAAGAEVGNVLVVPFLAVAAPLLGEVGAAADETNADKEAVAKAILADPLAGGDSVAQTFGEAGCPNGALERNGVAVVLVGHGTSHAAALTYAQMQAQMTKLEYINIFIGTVEGNPQSTSMGEVPFAVLRKGYKKVLVRPFLVASGDHARNDILADGGSWYSKFKSFQGIDAVGRSYGALGRIPEVQDVYIQHVKDAIQ